MMTTEETKQLYDYSVIAKDCLALGDEKLCMQGVPFYPYPGKRFNWQVAEIFGLLNPKGEK